MISPLFAVTVFVVAVILLALIEIQGRKPAPRLMALRVSPRRIRLRRRR